jgi:hypothetical protein
LTVTLELVVIRIDDLEVLLGDSASALVFVEPEDTLEELNHLLLVFVPHGSARVNSGHVVAALYRGRRCTRAVGLLVDRLVIAVAFLLFDLRQVLRTNRGRITGHRNGAAPSLSHSLSPTPPFSSLLLSIQLAPSLYLSVYLSLYLCTRFPCLDRTDNRFGMDLRSHVFSRDYRLALFLLRQFSGVSVSTNVITSYGYYPALLQFLIIRFYLIECFSINLDSLTMECVKK